MYTRLALTDQFLFGIGLQIHIGRGFHPGCRQVDVESGALAHFALGLDAAAVVLGLGHLI